MFSRLCNAINTFKIPAPTSASDITVADDEHHGHLPDIQTVEKLRILNEMKRACCDESIGAHQTDLRRHSTAPEPEDIPLFDQVNTVKYVIMDH